MKNKMSITKESDDSNERVVLSKRTDTEEITKTIEKISNGYLLTVEIWNFKDNLKSKNLKKFFEKNPLEAGEEEDSESKEEDKNTSEFMENWNILEIK